MNPATEAVDPELVAYEHGYRQGWQDRGAVAWELLPPSIAPNAPSYAELHSRRNLEVA